MTSTNLIQTEELLHRSIYETGNCEPLPPQQMPRGLNEMHSQDDFPKQLKTPAHFPPKLPFL